MTTEKHLRRVNRLGAIRRAWERDMESAPATAVPTQADGTKGATAGAALTEREAKDICDAGGLPLPPLPANINAWVGTTPADVGANYRYVRDMFDWFGAALLIRLEHIKENSPREACSHFDADELTMRLITTRDWLLRVIDAVEP